MDKKFGAHVSIAGGILNAFDRINNIGGNCMQIFSSSPRDWKPPEFSDEIVEDFSKLKKETFIDPVYFHANYLINLSGDISGELSKKSLITELNFASRMGIRGSVVHVGSFFEKEIPKSFDSQKYMVLLTNIQDILDETPEDTVFIIENSGTRKVGRSLDEIGFIVKRLVSPRVKVCLDTCHLHAAGYDLSTKEKLKEFLDAFENKIGLDRLELIHANESRDTFGSGRDRHENLGDGKVGNNVFVNLLNSPETARVPFIIETPGFDGSGPDEQNLDILKSFLS